MFVALVVCWNHKSTDSTKGVMMLQQLHPGKTPAEQLSDDAGYVVPRSRQIENRHRRN